MTYTYAIMHLSPPAYEEIAEKMRAADYGHAFHESRGQTVIDMHGLAVAAGPVDVYSPVDNPDTSADDPCDGIVAGDRLETTLNAFKLRARVLIEHEQRRASPDNALIDFLCNAVRLAREHAAAMQGPMGKIPKGIRSLLPPAFIDVIFDGPPAAESGRFVEVENERGEGVKVGEWIDRGNGLWALRIPR